MSSQEEIDQQQVLLRSYRRTLESYLSRLAVLGGVAYAPPEVINGIGEARREILRIKDILRGWGVSVDDHPDDEEPRNEANGMDWWRTRISEPTSPPSDRGDVSTPKIHSSALRRLPHKTILLVGLGLRWPWLSRQPRYLQSLIIGGLLIMLVMITIIIVRSFEWLSQPDWMRVTPTPSLPATAVISSSDLARCTQHNLASDLRDALQIIGLDSRVRIESTTSTEHEPLPAGSIVVVTGVCDPAHTEMLTVTLTFDAPPAYRVNLLHEPKYLSFYGKFTQARSFAQAGALYAIGEYESAGSRLAEVSSDPVVSDQADFDWLWANTLLRLERWTEAHEKYGRALRVRDDGTIEARTRRAKILANRGLAGLLQAQFSRDNATSNYTLCQTQSRSDAEEALELGSALSADERADLHVLLGTIKLYCSLDDLTLSQAFDEAEQATRLQPQSALAYTLYAEFIAYNLAQPDHGGAPAGERFACLARHIDPRLPDSYRVLGQIYAKYGMTAQARAEFDQYGRLATSGWQRRQAAQLLGQRVLFPLPQPPGLQGYCPKN